MVESLPLEIVISLFVLFIFFIFWIAVFVILYHLTRFGVGVQPKRLAGALLLGAVILFFSSTALFMNVDLNNILK